MVSSDKLQRMGRRRFTKVLAGLGLSGGVVSTISQNTLAKLTNDPTKEVPRVTGYVREDHNELDPNKPDPTDSPPERTTIYHTISRDKWVRIESANDALDKVAERLEKIGAHNVASPTVSYRTNGHHRERVIKVTYDEWIAERRSEELPDEENTVLSASEVFNELPTAVDGTVSSSELNFERGIENIPVIYESERRKPNACDRSGHRCAKRSSRDHYNDIYQTNPVPAGTSIAKKGDPLHASNAFRIYDPGSSTDDWGFLTSAHIMATDDHDDSSDMVGDPVYQPSYSNYVGDVTDAAYFSIDDDYGFYIDVASFSVARSVGTDYRLADGDGGYDEPVVGTVALDQLEDMAEDEKEICRQGTRSGRCSSTIYDFNTRVDEERAYFQTDDHITDNGDSGGPYFINHPDNDGQVLAAGIHYGPEDSIDSIAYAAAAAEKVLNVMIS
ncbi:hypothetical protein SAMN05444422_10131 [Halobiforma haloterrestris]|uniref:Peptidase S1 domain-containing protein n=1 Tax=Natronobacterium haloterrestre TaxID=148448 RepID=A0A1I1CXJ3_NATHA|nr:MULTISPECIES: hypothetical protein [Halobiforma]SFB67381.1 hypothetical protein SAMN05444422_10131 [Halobiforma haloterrestris]